MLFAVMCVKCFVVIEFARVDIKEIAACVLQHG